MVLRSAFAALVSLLLTFGLSVPAQAVDAVAAKEYAIRVQHTELSRIALEKGHRGLELQLTLTNRGVHDLYDVRLYVLRAASRTLVGEQEPARLRKLSPGEQASLTWTFELTKPLAGPLNDVVFRVEAVDRSTQRIVTFNQKSVEVR
jgi:hypothetical protein